MRGKPSTIGGNPQGRDMTRPCNVTCACPWSGLSVVIVNWFERGRSRALSTTQVGAAVGGLLGVAIAIVLDTFGLRSTP